MKKNDILLKIGSILSLFGILITFALGCKKNNQEQTNQLTYIKSAKLGNDTLRIVDLSHLYDRIEYIHYKNDLIDDSVATFLNLIHSDPEIKRFINSKGSFESLKKLKVTDKDIANLSIQMSYLNLRNDDSDINNHRSGLLEIRNILTGKFIRNKSFGFDIILFANGSE